MNAICDLNTQSEQSDNSTCAQDVTVHYRPRKARPRGGSNVLLALLLAGAAYTYFMYVRTGPQMASAAIAETVTAAGAVRSFVTAAPANIKGMERVLRNTKKSISQLASFQDVRQIPLADLRTNPFGADASPASLQTGVAMKTRFDQQRQAALRSVQNLQLQSVYIDDKNRSCVINNGMFVEGQQVDQFTIESIVSGAVIVRTGAFRFELRAQR